MSVIRTLVANRFQGVLARQLSTKTLISRVSDSSIPSVIADDVVSVDSEVLEPNLPAVKPKLRSLSSIFANPNPRSASKVKKPRKSVGNSSPRSVSSPSSVRNIDKTRKCSLNPNSVTSISEPCKKSSGNTELVSNEAIGITPKPKSVSRIGKPRKSTLNPKSVSKIDRPCEKSTTSANSVLSVACDTTGNESRKVISATVKKEKMGSLLNSSMFGQLEEKQFPEKLPTEVTTLVNRLRDEGYLKAANFNGKVGIDAGEIPVTLYSRHFLKSAAEKFGEDYREIAKWLSGSDLKKVALSGCPSIERKTVFAAKRLRSFFKIQEDVICRGCKLKSHCKFVNQRVGRVENVILSDTMRILTLLALEAVPKQLSIPSDLKSSICKLLAEVVNLSNLKSMPTKC